MLAPSGNACAPPQVTPALTPAAMPALALSRSLLSGRGSARHACVRLLQSRLRFPERSSAARPLTPAAAPSGNASVCPLPERPRSPESSRPALAPSRLPGLRVLQPPPLQLLHSINSTDLAIAAESKKYHYGNVSGTNAGIREGGAQALRKGKGEALRKEKSTCWMVIFSYWEKLPAIWCGLCGSDCF